MSMLAKLSYNLIVGNSAVRSIEELTPSLTTGLGRSEITFVDGRTKIINAPLHKLDRFTGTVIPAPPGFTLIMAHEGEAGEEPFFNILPVLAFRTTDDFPMPTTPRGEPDEDQAWGLILPDGRVDVPWDQMFDNVEAFRAWFKREITERAAA